MRLLLDQGMPADAASLFRTLGHDCLHTSECGMQRSEDENILTWASNNGYTVITLDADFHSLVAVRRLLGPSVVRLRREGCRAEDVVRILQPLLFRYQTLLAEGCLVSVREHRVTVRRLPIEPGL